MSPFFQKDSLHFSQVKLPVKNDKIVWFLMDGSFATENNAKNQSGKSKPKRKILHLTNPISVRSTTSMSRFFSSFGKKQQAPNLQQPTKHILIRNSCQFSPEIIDKRSYNKTHRHISHTSHTESRGQ